MRPDGLTLCFRPGWVKEFLAGGLRVVLFTLGLNTLAQKRLAF